MSNVITIVKGDSTTWNSGNLLTVTFNTSIDLTGFSALFKIGDIEFNINDLSTKSFNINLNEEQTQSLPLGVLNGSLFVFDKENKQKTFSTVIPFFVKNWVENDVHTDDYNLTFNVVDQDSIILNINIQTGTVDLSGIENSIETLQDDKADKSSVYNKTEIDDLVGDVEYLIEEL